jgi:aspartyl aminopeptidase
LPALLMPLADDDTLEFADLLKQQIIKQSKAVSGESNVVSVKQMLGYELSLYDSQSAGYVGLNNEFLVSARLDNLLSCYCALNALSEANHNGHSLIVLTDHEEVGSVTSSGAMGTFLPSVLRRLCLDEELYQRTINRSFLVSSDNAHGIHPNYPEKHEPDHLPMINEGPVIKINNNQRYATNSRTESLFRKVCQDVAVPVQTFVTRSDLGCGSTIGPLMASRLGVDTIDIGVPQLAMHSIRETAGAEDVDYLTRALRGVFESDAF